MKTWLSRWRSGRNSKISYKLLVDQTDSHSQFGANKVKMTTQNRNDDEDAAYAIESGGLLGEKYHVSVGLEKLLCG